MDTHFNNDFFISYSDNILTYLGMPGPFCPFLGTGMHFWSSKVSFLKSAPKNCVGYQFSGSYVKNIKLPIFGACLGPFFPILGLKLANISPRYQIMWPMLAYVTHNGVAMACVWYLSNLIRTLGYLREPMDERTSIFGGLVSTEVENSECL